MEKGNCYIFELTVRFSVEEDKEEEQQEEGEEKQL
jgi:hypothetical protein